MTNSLAVEVGVNKILLISLLIFTCNGNDDIKTNVIVSGIYLENEVEANLTAALTHERNKNSVLQAALEQCRKRVLAAALILDDRSVNSILETSVEEYKKNETTVVQSRIECEWTTMRLVCSAPNTVIHILSANYGRTQPGSIVCPNANIRTTECYAKNSMNILTNKCQGKSACEVAATNAVFGDPCVHTFKYLSVEFKCVELS